MQGHVFVASRHLAFHYGVEHSDLETVVGVMIGLVRMVLTCSLWDAEIIAAFVFERKEMWGRTCDDLHPTIRIN